MNTHDYGFVFWPKNHEKVLMYIIVIQNPRFSTIPIVLFTQTLLNFFIVFIINNTTFWQELMMHHTIVIKENSKQNFHILSNLACFFRSWLIWQLPMRWLGLGFTSYNPFEKTRRDIAQNLAQKKRLKSKRT